MQSNARRTLSSTHRLLGLVATIPLLGWVLSSFVLHGVGLALPNGLQGTYVLGKGTPATAPLESAELKTPSEIFASLRADGVSRVHWLRLEGLGGTPAYVVKPGPYELERVYDATTGQRLDPLPDSVLRRVVDEELEGTRAAELVEADEFNRYYTLDRVPAVRATMEGTQPSEIVVSRASGRVLRRTDPLAAWFDRAYRSVHVWQWGDALRSFTALLYGLVALVVVLVALGYTLWWDRRDRRSRWGSGVRPARRLHARLAPWAGVVICTQMLVGAWLWFNLGLIEPRFRGQGSFATLWSGGIRTDEDLVPADEISQRLAAAAPGSTTAMRRYEWRAAGNDRFLLAYAARDARPVLLDARSGVRLDRLTEAQARAAAEGVVEGGAAGSAEPSTEYWMDANVRVPTYRFRFTDPDRSDVHVDQLTGEVIQRRPAIWRAFGPFLAYHTFGFTGNRWLDTLLLAALQATVLVMILSGWRLAGITRASRR